MTALTGTVRPGDAASAAPREVRAVLLASEERSIPDEAIDLAADIGRRAGAPVHVVSIARVWGTSLGFPNPGLMPTRAEWQAQHAVVTDAVRRLRRRGIKQAEGRVIGTRAAAKRIVGEATRLGCDVIVMGADPPRPRLVANMMWSQEPYRVRRRAKVPVLLVIEDA